MIKLDNKFDFGDTVYLKTDMDQKPRMVVAFEVYVGGETLYKLASGTLASYHYEMEISTDRDKMLLM